MNTIIEENSDKKRWSKSYEKDGITEEITVRKVENGYVVCRNRYGEDLNSSSPDKWIHEKEEYISTINPLEEEDLNEEFEELIKKFK